MAQEFWRADEAEAMIQEYLKYHADLIGAKIACVFKEKASKSDGVPIVGKISKVSSSNHPLMTETFDYKIEIGADAWAELDMKQREAWIDHLMEHAYGEENEQNGELTWKLRRPELIGFPSVINRHGLTWMSGLDRIPTIISNAAKSVPPTVRATTAPVNGTPSYDDLTDDLN